MGWYKDIQNILCDEPETWLEYLYGQRLDNIEYLTTKGPRFKNLFLNGLKVFYFYLKNIRVNKNYSRYMSEGYQFFVYAGTLNQANSLNGVIDALRNNNYSVLSIVENKIKNEYGIFGRYSDYSIGLCDAIRALLLSLVRAKNIFIQLKLKNPIAKSWYINRFFLTHAYLVFFYSLFLQHKPEMIIMSNDHNAQNRCLLAVARHFSIDTVYLQHASVSSLFPALSVSYAFLDGLCAYDIYRKCQSNIPSTLQSLPSPRFFLSGQKKNLIHKKKNGDLSVGIAIGLTDNLDKQISLVQLLVNSKMKVYLRWHPRQSKNDREILNNVFSYNNSVKISNPANHSLGDFFNNINCLVAGDSSIHIEAALAHIKTIYYKSSNSDIVDYYGYVENKISICALTDTDLLSLIQNIDSIHPVNYDAIRYYSATFQTEWEGKEGALVANILINIVNGESAENQYGYFIPNV